MPAQNKVENALESNDDFLHTLGYTSLAILGASGLFYLGSLVYKNKHGNATQKTEAKKDIKVLKEKLDASKDINVVVSNADKTEITEDEESGKMSLKRKPSYKEIDDGYLKVKDNLVRNESVGTRSPYPDIIPGNMKGSKTIIKKAKYHLQTRFNEEKGKKIYKFVITGGPCAGKSTCLTWLSEKFKPKYEVFIVPECATLTITSGFNIFPDRFTTAQHVEVITGMMKYQMDMENYFYDVAKDEKKDVIIITDRGMLDNFAYCKPEVKEKVLKNTNWKISEVNQQ